MHHSPLASASKHRRDARPVAIDSLWSQEMGPKELLEQQWDQADQFLVL